MFAKYRDTVLSGNGFDSGWAEWSVQEQHDPGDVESWYETNPSLGTILTERKIRAEITTDDIDFNIQRLGLWLKYNQKSAISRNEWEAIRLSKLPAFKGQLFAGIKYGVDGTSVAMSIAVKTEDGRIFVESIDCRPIRAGNAWIIEFLKASPGIGGVAIDGANGQKILEEDMKEARLKAPVLPTVKQIIVANAAFELGLEKTICHMGQPSLSQAVTNCEKRAIGANGGFGYRAQKEGVEIALLDSVILAYWMCRESKEKKKQRISY